jgi:geranylgeranyl diphosphate synthase type I
LTVHADTRPDVTAFLDGVRALVLPELRTVVARLDPRLAAGGQGTLLHPALTVLAAEALGGSGPSVVSGAVAVELVHNGTLVPDTVVGDALRALALELLAEHESRRPARMLSVALRDQVSGQDRDRRFRDRPWQGADAVGVDEYRAMAMAKTGALMSAALAIGAELAGGGPEVITILAQVGQHLGLASQCVADVLGIRGDVREGRKTLPVLAALAGPDGRQLAELLADPERTEPVLRRAATLVEWSGGRVLAQREAVRQIDRVRELLACVPMPAAVRDQFAALCEALVGRVR